MRPPCMWMQILASVILTKQTPPSNSFELTGTVGTRLRMALPANAEVVIAVDKFTAEGQVQIAETRMVTGGQQVPYAWRMAIPSIHRTPGSRLGLRARIEFGGRAQLETPRHTMISGAGRDLALDLVRAAPVPWEVLGVDWQLVSIEDRPTPGNRPPTLRLNRDGTLNGFSGVNRFGGSFEYRAPSVQIDPGAMTMMAGSPDAMEMEANLLRLLPLVNRATIHSGELVLSRGEKMLLRWRRTGGR